MDDGQVIHAGDRFYEIPSGLHVSRATAARIIELLEACPPDDAATLATIDGIVELGPISGSERRVFIRDGAEACERRVPITAALCVTHGERVRAGERLSHGEPAPGDLVEVTGEDEARLYLLEKLLRLIQSDHDRPPRPQHAELLLREMFRWVQVTDEKGTSFDRGQIVDRFHFDKENERVGWQALARANPVVVGISQVARLK